MEHQSLGLEITFMLPCGNTLHFADVWKKEPTIKFQTKRNVGSRHQRTEKWLIKLLEWGLCELRHYPRLYVTCQATPWRVRTSPTRCLTMNVWRFPFGNNQKWVNGSSVTPLYSVVSTEQVCGTGESYNQAPRYVPWSEEKIVPDRKIF